MAKCRQADVQDEESKGQSSVVTDETKGKIEVKVQEDRYDCQSCYANSWVWMSLPGFSK